MIRKYASVFVALCLVFALATGCSDGEPSQAAGGNQNTPGAPAAAGDGYEENAGAQAGSGTEDDNAGEAVAQPGSSVDETQESPGAPASDFDVDLTLLSSTMVFAEVYNILDKPENYLGKTMKMRGTYYAFGVEEADLYLHFIIIEDAASCCAQGLQFMLSGERTYPEDYPDDFVSIELTGVYKHHDGSSATGYYLLVDDIFLLSGY